jgi:hypothetical protein
VLRNRPGYGAEHEADRRVVVQADGASPAVVDVEALGCDLGDVCEQVARSAMTITLDQWRALRAEGAA